MLMYNQTLVLRKLHVQGRITLQIMRVPELKQKQLPTTFAEKNETEMLFLYVTRLALLATVLMALLISKPNSIVRQLICKCVKFSSRAGSLDCLTVMVRCNSIINTILCQLLVFDFLMLCAPFSCKGILPLTQQLFCEVFWRGKTSTSLV